MPEIVRFENLYLIRDDRALQLVCRSVRAEIRRLRQENAPQTKIDARNTYLNQLIRARTFIPFA